jgi:hypothetical protein
MLRRRIRRSPQHPSCYTLRRANWWTSLRNSSSTENRSRTTLVALLLTFTSTARRVASFAQNAPSTSANSVKMSMPSSSSNSAPIHSTPLIFVTRNLKRESTGLSSSPTSRLSREARVYQRGHHDWKISGQSS